MIKRLVLLIIVCGICYACGQTPSDGSRRLVGGQNGHDLSKIEPVTVTEPVKHDTDDPAIWIDPQDPSKSLIIGTDKHDEGALYVYDLEGKILEEKVVRGLKRPNNVDIEYGFMINGKSVDIAVTTERYTNKIRVFSLPDMQPIDNGGIEVFEGEEFRAPMGVSLYKRPSDGNIYALVGRKDGPQNGTYLWQYLLQAKANGQVTATKVREFGNYSGNKEIESIAVDDQLGYIYYSDEGAGVRKYYANPDSSNIELGMFATSGFMEDHEGISIYDLDEEKGYIIVSDQQANNFHIFTREGTAEDPHDHQLVKIFNSSTLNSDGSEVTHRALNSNFPEGLFVAMSDDKTFHYYSWRDIMGTGTLGTK
jgi:3-phytase